MDFRLGEYECPACGRREAAQPEPAAAPARGAPQWSSPPSPPAGDNPGYSRIGLKPASEGAETRPGYNVEKAAFLTVFLVVQIGVSFLYIAQTVGAGPEVAALSLPGLIISALVSTAGAAIVLYLDNSCVKNSCLVLIGLSVLGYILTIIMAIKTHLLGLCGGLIVNTLVYGWLVSILQRDTQMS